MKKEINISYQGVELLVVAEITGDYMPATQLYPEEYAEIEVLEVFVGDTDIMGIFYDTQILDIGDLCLINLEG
jgi:hypothetical protein